MPLHFLYNKNDLIDGHKVEFPIQHTQYAQSYRVKHADGHRYFMKVINTTQLSSNQLDKNNAIREIEVAKAFDHPNLCPCVREGILIHKGIRWAYFTTPFISSESLSDRMARSGFLNSFDAKEVAKGVLKALSYIHKKEIPLIHCSVTPQHVLLDFTKKLADCKLIHFEYAQELDYVSLSIWKSDTLNPFYIAPEMLHEQLSIQSDIFAVGAMLFHTIYGIPPYFTDLSNLSREGKIEALQQSRAKGLKLPNLSTFEQDEALEAIVKKALSLKVENRFQSAEEFLDALEGRFVLSCQGNHTTAPPSPKRIPRGNGFDDVAGMHELKKILQTRIINILKDKETADRYKLQIPNGMLLYGPPGCGKSFIAEKFAEEAGYTYTYVKSSDLASIYVHGSQQKIGELFDTARTNAPTIINFDEFDALVPDRNKTNSTSVAGEVNEFLSQLNNCGRDGVFVIASSNRPELIDKAILRRGRIDKIVYVPLPDHDARKGMFTLYLKDRPTDFGIDYDKLASLTENYVSSDISYIINEAAIKAASSSEVITEETLIECIKLTKPSVSADTIAHYEQLRIKMEGINSGIRKSGIENS